MSALLLSLLSPSLFFLLCLIAASSHALTFSTSGPGLAPCGDQLCVDLAWSWEGETTEASGEVPLVLPAPDPAVWELGGGRLTSGASASYLGQFDPSDVEQVTDPPGDTFVGTVVPRFLVLGAGGEPLLEHVNVLAANCLLDEPGPTISCGDSNVLGNLEYEVPPRDAAFSGPLTIRYGFERDLEIVSQSERFGVNLGGTVQLIYQLVIPEPGTGLLLMTGLLGLAWRRSSPLPRN